MTWAITAAATIGIEVAVAASLPSVASASTTVSASLSLSTTAEQSFDSSSTWSVETQVTIPPDSIIVAEMQLQCGDVSVPFTAPVLLTGSVAYMLQHSDGKQELRLQLIGLVLNGLITNNLTDCTGYTIYDPEHAGGVLVNATGTFKSGIGLSRSVRVDQFPYNPDETTSGAPSSTKELATA